MTDSIAALVERHMERPLGGEHCFAPVADALVEMGRSDPSGAYAALTRAELQELPDPPDAVGRSLGAIGGREIDPGEARPGDVGARRVPGGWTVGMMARRWLWKSERGVLVGGKAERAWRVG